MALLAHLRLVRWPGALTAAANAATGFLVTHDASTTSNSRAAAAVALAGAVVYSGGVVLNDVADAARDVEIHPTRPIPSGAVTRASAARFGAALLVGGAVLSCALAGPWAGAATAAAALFAWAYDAGAKRLRVPGAAVLGLARAANACAGVLAGAASADVFGDARAPAAVVYPAAVFAYTAILTVASTLEGTRASKAALGVWAGALFVAAAVPWTTFRGEWRAAPAMAYAPLLFVLAAAARAAAEEDGPGMGALVRAGVFGFLLVDAAWLFGAQRYGAGFGAVLGYVVLRLVLARSRS